MFPEKSVYAVGNALELEPGTEEIVEVEACLELLQTGGFLTEEDVTDVGEEESLLTATEEQASYEEIELALLTSFDLLQETCDVSKFHIQKSDISGILKRVLNSNPRYFYAGIKSYYVNTKTQEVTSIIITYSGAEDDDYDALLKKYDDAVEKIVKAADASWSDLEKVLYINDYLCRNCQYDLNGENDNRYNAYGTFIDKKAVCQGYSLAFLELSKRLGVDCTLVTSTSIKHAWNMVCINGEYYYIDATWNDPNPDRLGRVKHIFFLKSYDYFAAQDAGYTTHLGEQDWVIANGLTYEVADSTYYDSYFMNNYNVGFSYVDGNWYGYNGKESKQDGVIERFICDGKDFIYQEAVVDVQNKWYPLDSQDTYYYNQSGIDGKKGFLFYSDNIHIYIYHIGSGVQSVLHTLSEEEQSVGSIYGICRSSEKGIYYLLAPSPSDIDAGQIIYIDFSTIHYHLDGGKNHKGNPVWHDGQNKVVFEKPVKAGYTFEGWYLDEQFDKTITGIEKGSSGDLELYAKWSPETYQIQYVLNGGTNDTDNPATYTCESEDIILKKPVRTGYTFGGWYQDEAYETSERVLGISEGSTGDITLYAQWIENTYTILFNGNGATSGAVQALNCKYGQSYLLNPNTYKKTGYTFKGWAKSLADANKGIVSYRDKDFVYKMTSQNGEIYTLYAVWSKDDFTITYVLNGGRKNENPAGYNVTSPTIQLKNPVRTGYTFGGWYLDSVFSANKKVTQIVTGRTGNLTLYARWTANRYTIKFKGNGATSGSMKNKTCSYDKRYRLPANKFKKKGYTFKGWATSAKKAKKGIVAYKNKAYIKNVTSKNKGTKTLYAVWKKKK